MASHAPLNLKLFVEMSRDPKSFEKKAGRSFEELISPGDLPILSYCPDAPDLSEASTSPNPTTPLSDAWWLEKLPRAQIEHHLDWICINRTCHRFRDCGRISFFSEKTFIIKPRLLVDLRGSFTYGINPAIFSMVQRHVSKVIIPIQFNSSTPWIILPKVHQVFQHLHTLYIYEDVIADMPRNPESKPKPSIEDPPPELQRLLQVLGLQLDRLDFKIVKIESAAHRGNSTWLNKSVYPLLKFMADRKQARKRELLNH